MRRRQQGGDFRCRALSVFAPAAGFADIDEFDDRAGALGLLSLLGELTLFLGASHHYIGA